MKTKFNDAALAALSAIDPVDYSTNRNFIGKGTRLSMYITRGVLTLPQIKSYLVDSFEPDEIYSLLFELAWREYWQREWIVRGEAIFDDLKNPQENVESHDMPSAVIDAATGITVIDEGIKEVYETGYLHNHMRLWISGLLCNIAHTWWPQPAKWMYYYLLDGDPASNFLSWQWVAGTFSSKRYLPAQENINHYSHTSQQQTFLDRSYDELADMDTPTVLRTRRAIELIWEPPKTEILRLNPALPTLLYHCFWLNAQWHKDMEANRVLVLEPSWFTKFPVSQNVTRSILDIASEISGMQLFVGEFDELASQLGDEAHFVSHPSVEHWRGIKEAMPMMFPNVPLRSYNSFMSFWKKCQKEL